jgi:hypothetical protein
MSNVAVTANRATKWMRWIARGWSILIIAFTLMMVIGYAWSWVTTGKADPYAVEDYPPIENLPPLFSLLSVLGLALAWRWERLGGTIAVIFSLAVLPILLIHWPITHNFPHYFVAPYGVWMIILIPGVLFSVCGYQSKKSTRSQLGI